MARRSFSIFRISLMFLESAVLIPLFFVLSILIPYRQIYSFSVCLGRIFYRISKKNQHIIKTNLSIIFPHKVYDDEMRNEIGAVIFGYQLRIILEMISFSRMSFQEIFSYLEFYDPKSLGQILDGKTNPSLAFTLHYGNWELSGMILSFLGISVISLAERQFNPFINAYLFRLRKNLGIETVYNEISNMRPIIRHLKKDGTMVGILADQTHWYDPMFISFFGKEAAVPKGVAQLLYRARSESIFFGYTEYLSNGRYGFFSPELPTIQYGDNREKDIENIMKMIYSAYEKVIIQNVKNWYTIGTDRWALDRKALKAWQENPDSDPF